MEFIDNLGLGFAVALQWQNLLYCLVGVLLGTVVGILPGLGPLATIAMLLPLTFGMSATEALIMLAGIYYGSQYGGSTTAILINLPGESSSVVTAIDGYRMAQRGRGGPALAAAAIASFIAGSVATLIIAIVATPLTRLALSFGAAEYFSLLLVGLFSSIALASGSILKAIGMICLGLLVGLTGTDMYTATPRFTFGHTEMLDGIDFVAIAVGIFGIGEILRNLERSGDGGTLVSKVTSIMPSRDEFRRIITPSIRGTAIGSFLGILPGGGALLSSFVAYNVEKKVSPNAAEFGNGAIEGVAAPESANNAGAQTSFIPMLSLGIPSNVVMALMIGAMMVQGITPGPEVLTKQPDLFWGLIASMWIGNAMLVILNFPLIGIWVRLLTIPYSKLFPAIIVFCCIGVFSVSNSSFDVYLALIAGLIGYILVKLDFELPPFVLGFILGPMLEENLRRALLISGGDLSIFVTRPISAVLLIIAVLTLIVVSLPGIAKRRKVLFRED